MVVAIIAALVLAASTVFWLKSRRSAAPSGRQPASTKTLPVGRSAVSAAPSKAGGRFAAVEIRTRAGACRTAQALEGSRFLAKDAPALPLPNCTSVQCTCLFSKLPDRRTEGRRLDYGGLSASQFLDKNRRTKRDRRAARARHRN